MDEQQYPSLMRRFIILNYDGLLLMAVSMTYGLLYIAINKWVFGIEADRAAGLLFQIGWLLTLFGFFCYFWKRGGQTTGMRAWRVKLMNSNGKSPCIRQCALRFLLALIGWTCFFTIWMHPRRQMLHDQWSHTRLVLLPKDK